MPSSDESPERSTVSGPLAFLAGGGEMGERIRTFDWTKTPLGAPESWPLSLKTAVRIMLTSQQPIWVSWGPEMIYLYNDPYREIVGGRHPRALGSPLSEIWTELWSTIEPMLNQVMEGDEGIFVEEQLFIMERHGYPEETYYTFSYSPIPSDATGSGGAGGIICANADSTHNVISERQIDLLRGVAADSSEIRSTEAVFARAEEKLATNPQDLPFAAIYQMTESGDAIRRVAAVNLPADHPSLPIELALRDKRWPLASVFETGEAVLVTSLPDSGEVGYPVGSWDQPPREVKILPLALGKETQRPSVLLVGLNPFRRYDESYRSFLHLVATQLKSNLRSAKAYEEERERVQQLAALDRAKTTFFSNVSHEFRTPLTLLLGPIQELLEQTDDNSPSREKELLELAKRNGLRLQRLVNALLDFSRIEAGRARGRFQALDLAKLTAEFASNFSSVCKRAALEYSVQCDPLSQPVFVDPEMWEKVVLNLISNAFKFTLSGAIEVTLKEAENGMLFKVTDTGPGIPPEEMPKLFERFHRIEGAPSRTVEGSGIGLALVQELVHLHGGKVEAESTLGEGTTMTVFLPFGVDHLPAGQVLDRVDPKRSLNTANPFIDEALGWIHPPTELIMEDHGDPLAELTSVRQRTDRIDRILIADDNQDMRDYLRRLLQTGFEVQAVHNGKEALEAIVQNPPDLLLSDGMMPEIDGYQLTAMLRQNPQTRDLPIIILSARAGEEARIEGLATGADDYLTKPFGARELIARVDATLSLARARQEAAAELRESEGRFRNVAEHSPLILWMTEANGDCMYLNGQWADFTGQPVEEGLGKGWLECVHPDDRAMTSEAFLEAARERQGVRLNYRLRRQDGTFRWVIDSAVPRFGSDNELLGFIGSVLDIHDLKSIERKLREEDQRKNEFLATLAHELRNPLAPIRSGIKVIKMALRKEAPERIEEVCGIIETQTEQLVTLIDDLLEISRITRGKLELRRTEVELSDIVARAVDTSAPLIERMRHTLLIRPSPHAIHLQADRHRLCQVVSNLLNNAAKYTPEGGRIVLSTKLEGDQAVISVSDNGIGLAAEDCERIFEMFTQLGRSLRPGSYDGLGIGLSLARQLVEKHGGHISVSSPGIDQGSTFSVTLPATPQPPTEPVSNNQPASMDPSSVSKKVLIVDDNEDAARTLQMVLEMFGATTQVAHDGLAGVEAAAEFSPDLVLMDIGMPRLDGHEAARRIRQEPWGKNIRLVALTGWGQDEDRQKSKDAGFDHHVVKPVDPDELQTLFEELP
jgi:PAS domain S-box-containing protein